MNFNMHSHLESGNEINKVPIMKSIISLATLIIIVYGVVNALIDSFIIKSVPGIFFYSVALFTITLLSIGIIKKIKNDENEQNKNTPQ